jgi:prephenate dehydratase
MAKVQRVKYFKANLENKPGALLKIVNELKAKNLGLSGLWGFATQPGKAELYVVPKNPDKLRALWSASGLLADEGIALWWKGADRTGALAKSLEALAAAGVNIESIDAVAVNGRFGSAIWVSPAEIETAAKALGAK